MAFADILSITPVISAGGDTVPMPYPDVVQSGRIILCIIMDRGLSGSPTVPDGWTHELSYSVFAPLYSKLHIFSRVSDGTETGIVDFEMHVTNRKLGVMLGTNAESIHAIGDPSYTVESLSIDHARVTTTEDETRLIYIFGVMNLDVVPDFDEFTVAAENIAEGVNPLTPNASYLAIGQEWFFGQTLTPLRTSVTTVDDNPALMQCTVALFRSGPPTQLILSIDGDDVVTDGQQAVSVTHQSFFGAIESVTLNATYEEYTFTQALSFVAGTGEEVLVDFPDISAFASAAGIDGVPLSGGVFKLSLTIADATHEASRNLTLQEKAGQALRYVVGPLKQQGSLFDGVTGDVLENCQIYFNELSGDFNVINNGVLFSNQDPGSTAGANVFDISDGKWKYLTVQFENFVADPEPNPFSFSPVGEADFITQRDEQSNIITLTGINIPIPVHIESDDGGEYRYRASAENTWSNWLAVGQTGEVGPMYQVQLQVANALEPETQTSVTFFAGSQSATFTVTTRAIPATDPGPGAEPGSEVEASSDVNRKITKSIQGDTWDVISYRLFQSEMYTHELMRVNFENRNISIFPAGVSIVIPEIDVTTTVSSALPPWRRR